MEVCLWYGESVNVCDCAEHEIGILWVIGSFLSCYIVVENIPFGCMPVKYNVIAFIDVVSGCKECFHFLADPCSVPGDVCDVVVGTDHWLIDWQCVGWWWCIDDIGRSVLCCLQCTLETANGGVVGTDVANCVCIVGVQSSSQILHFNLCLRIGIYISTTECLDLFEGFKLVHQ